MIARFILGLIALIAITLGAWFIDLGTLWDARLQDALLQTRLVRDRIVIVDIDDASLRAHGQWPWPRASFAQLIQRIGAADIIGIDVNFKEPSRLGAHDDAMLAQAIARTSASIVVTSDVTREGALAPLISAVARAEKGFANIAVDADGVARRVRMYRGETESFSALVARLAGAPLPRHTQDLRRIFFAGGEQSFPHVRAIDVLEGVVDTSLFTNNIVLIGATAADLQDTHSTPFGVMSGVTIQAHAIEQFLNNTHERSVGDWVPIFIIVGYCIGSLVMRYSPMHISIPSIAGTTFAYVGVASFLMSRAITLPILYPVVALIGGASYGVIMRYRATHQEKKFIQESFSRYLAPAVIQQIVQNPSMLRLGGSRATLSILFSDVRGFTTLSETLTPEQLTAFLNRYLTRMTTIILGRRGVIDKYIGDAIMAFWGAPLPSQTHAHDAVISALEMTTALDVFNTESETRGDPHIDIGIGINTGDVTVGNMGSEQRFDYTVMGDAVNLASRLESLTKMYGVRILITEKTKLALGNEATHIPMRNIDCVQVKGKTEGVTIYEVIPSGRVSLWESIAADFIELRNAYAQGAWDRASLYAQRALSRAPHDGPTQLLAERIAYFKEHPPETWNGVYEMKHK
ncbi:MAG: adenylate/guanylate cyclase domain-containing protein [Patescibacteria group bacterium]